MYREIDKQHPHHSTCPDCNFLGNSDGWDLYCCEKHNDKQRIATVVAINPDIQATELSALDAKYCNTHPALTKVLKRANEIGFKLRDQ